MRRFWRGVLAVLLSVSLLMPSVLAAGSPDEPKEAETFTDVEEGQWFYSYVTEMTERGLIKGYGDGTFAPDDTTRNGDCILLEVRTVRGAEPETPQDTHYAMGAVEYAVEQGWLDREEIPEELNDPASRLFICQLAAKALNLNPVMRDPSLGITVPSPFQDVDDGYITALYEAGIVEGRLTEDGGRVFGPEDSLTRAELCALIYRVMDHLDSHPLPENPEEPGNTEDPENPGEPGSTENPENPGEPGSTEDPENPGEPGNTVNPDDPETSGDPEPPKDPEDPETNSTGGGTVQPENPEDGYTQPLKQITFSNRKINVYPEIPINPYNKYGYGTENGRKTYSFNGVTAEFGVDVSSHQGPIKWAEVAADGVKFALIRAGGRYYGKSSGTIFPDVQFSANMKGAAAQGITTGVYFFSQALNENEAIAEAEFVVEKLKDFPDFQGMVVFDWENIGTEPARTDNMTAAQVTKAALAFCKVVEDAGYQPMIYFNRYIAYLLYELDQVYQYPFWVADYVSTPVFYYDFEIWQYTDKGTVKGIPGKVDMNLWFHKS